MSEGHGPHKSEAQKGGQPPGLIVSKKELAEKWTEAIIAALKIQYS
jgi:hypothetical protein